MPVIVRKMSCTGPLANRNFRQWTEGLDTRRSMVSIFNRIRDIPYALVPARGSRDPDDLAERMLRDGKGSCAPKHYLLAAMYRRLNLNVVYATFPFRWGDLEIRYPPALREESDGLPLVYHLACRVQVGCRWALVDATWDPPLGKAGFPVNLHWDGIAETRCAVLPVGAPFRKARARSLPGGSCGKPDGATIVPVEGERDHWEAEDREKYYRQNVKKRTPSDVERTTRFYDDLNTWMEQVRQQENGTAIL